MIFLSEFDIYGRDRYDDNYELLTTFIDLISYLLEDRTPDLTRRVVCRHEQAAYVLVLTNE